MTTSTSMAASMNNRALARAVGASERFLGSYVYGGTQVSLLDAGMASDQLRQIVYGWGAPFIPNQGDLDFNRRQLAAAPLGSTVTLRSTQRSGWVFESWTKEGPCKWARTEWADDAPDGSGTFWSPETGFLEWEPKEEEEEY